MTPRSARTAALTLGALLLIAGCSSSPADTSPAAAGSSAPPTTATPPSTSPSTPASSGAAGAGGNTMDISGFTFAAITVKPGATVTVTNADSVAHTVNVNGTKIDLNVPGGGQATFTAPAKPGSYPLTCDFHHSMHGTLTVAA